MLSKSLKRIMQTMKGSRFKYAAIFALLVLVLVIGAVQASGPMRPPQPPQPCRMMCGGMQMPKWGHWMPWMPAQPVPQMKVLIVLKDVGILVETKDFPEDEDFTVTMGKMHTQGIGGTEVAEFNSADGEPKYLVFLIPEDLRGDYQISFRAQTDHTFPYYSYNWFYNTTAVAPDVTSVALADLETLTLDDAQTLIEAEFGGTAETPVEETAAEEPPAEEPPAETEAPAETGDAGTGGATEEQPAQAETPATGPTLTDAAWQWVEFTDPVQGTVAVDMPEQYVLQFMPEGLVGIKADCNTGNGTYIADEEGGIDIAIGALTLALCPPESLSDQFVEYVNEAAVYSFEDANLLLDLPADSGTMRFIAAGETEAPVEGEAEAPVEGEVEAPAEDEAEAPAEDAETEAPAEGEVVAVTGTITYMQRIALPDDAVVTVRIVNSSLADKTEVLGEQVIETAGQQVPIAFEVPYNAEDVNENLMYSVSARIDDAEGNLLFISDTATPVITNGNPTEDVEIVTIQPATGGAEAEAPAEDADAEAPAEGEAEAPAEDADAEAPAEGEAEATEGSLTGAAWNWTEFTDPVEGSLPVDSPELYTVAFLEDGTVAIKADCNNGSGSFVADEEGNIDITVGAVTLAMCAEDSLSDQFLQYIDAVTLYFFEEADLYMDLPVDSGTLHFAAGEMPEASTHVATVASTTTVPVASAPAGGSNGEENGDDMDEYSVPTIKVCAVEKDNWVYVTVENFPEEYEFAVKMGPPPVYVPVQKPMGPKPMPPMQKPMGPQPMPPMEMPPQPEPYQNGSMNGSMNPPMGQQPMGQKPMGHGSMWQQPAYKVWIPYYEAGTLEAGQTEGRFEIPAELVGNYRISLMMRSDHQFPYYSYNWFYNNTADVCNGNGEDVD